MHINRKSGLKNDNFKNEYKIENGVQYSTWYFDIVLINLNSDVALQKIKLIQPMLFKARII